MHHVSRRNQNYRDIIKGLTMSLGQKHLSLFDITNQFHHVFWLGDLNYRLEEDVQVRDHSSLVVMCDVGSRCVQFTLLATP